MLQSTSLSYAEIMKKASENQKKNEREMSKGKNSSSTSKDVKDMLLDQNIRKFKEKQEMEKKVLEENRRKKIDNLLKLRTSKATGRINRGLKLTKSSLKSVDEDSKNSYLNSVTMQGEYQPDEDDYGYTSQFTSEMHQKFLQKYNNPGIIPEAKKSTSNGIIPPESKSLEHRTKNYERSNENHKETTTEKDKTDQSKSKKKKVGPPPPDYKTILQIAEANKEKPEPFDPLSLLEIRREKEFEFERPMTQKEKEEYRKERQIKAKVERGHYLLNNNIEPKKQGPSKSSSTTQPQSFKIPKKSEPTSSKNVAQQKVPNEIKQPPFESRHDVKHVVSQNKYNNSNPSSSDKYDKNRDKISSKNSSSHDNTNSRHKDKYHPISSHNNNSINSSKSLPQSTLSKSKKVNSNDGYSSQKSNPSSSNYSSSTYEKGRERSNENSNLERERASESKFKLQTSKSKEYPTQSSSSQSSARKPTNQKEYASMPVVIKKEPREKPQHQERIPEKRRNDVPPNPYLHPRELPFIKRSKQADKPKRLVIESDDEYDSEMDDFIDDSEVPGEDISNMIGSLFKYDRTKYINEDSDDDVMESSFAQTQREEIRSLKIGIKEDREEELRQIEIEKRKKEILSKFKEKSKR